MSPRVELDPVRLGRTLDDLAAMGNRLHGTDGEARCREYLLGRFEALSLERVRLEPFRYLACEPVAATCERLRSGQSARLRCRPMLYAGNADAEGSVVYAGAGSDAELAALEDELEGKIVLVRSHDPFDVASSLAGRSVAGLVNISQAPEDLISDYTAALYPPPLEPPWAGRPLPYPAVTIAESDGNELVSELEAGETVVLRLHHRAVYTEKETANVVAELPAGGDEHVVVGAHYDSQADGPAICDNGTGLAALLETARVLGAHERSRGVVFVAFACEEIGFWGSTSFVAARGEQVEAIAAMVNLDNLSNVYAGGRTVFATGDLRGLVLECARDHGWAVDELLDATQHAYSDDAPFNRAGVPTCWLLEFPPLHPYYHTRGDTRERVDADRLARTASVAAEVALRLAAG